MQQYSSVAARKQNGKRNFGNLIKNSRKLVSHAENPVDYTTNLQIGFSATYTKKTSPLVPYAITSAPRKKSTPSPAIPFEQQKKLFLAQNGTIQN